MSRLVLASKSASRSALLNQMGAVFVLIFSRMAGEPVPPAQLAMATILQAYEDLSDEGTWSELERQLMSLSATASGAAMVHDLVAATRKQASFKPSELVMREILCIASAVMDETFPSDFSSSDSEADDLTI